MYSFTDLLELFDLLQVLATFLIEQQVELSILLHQILSDFRMVGLILEIQLILQDDECITQLLNLSLLVGDAILVLQIVVVQLIDQLMGLQVNRGGRGL